LAHQFPTGQPSAQSAPEERQQALLARYVRAWEGADLDGFVALLREDAVMSMPPWKQWYRGREAIRAFFAWAWRVDGHGPFRLVPTAANRQPALAMYRRAAEGPEGRAFAIVVLTLQDDAIAAMTTFVEPQLFAAFGLPLVLPSEAAPPPARA
jgi:RNA polymerase sigma-70 factor (ECF subfamily)